MRFSVIGFVVHFFCKKYFVLKDKLCTLVKDFFNVALLHSSIQCYNIFVDIVICLSLFVFNMMLYKKHWVYSACTKII